MTNSTTWEQSVEKARLASLKTFQGRIEMVVASWEQISRKSGGGNGKLIQFALDAGIEYKTLANARAVCDWLLPKEIVPEIGNDLVAAIGSWSLAAEASARREQFKNGAALAKYLLKNDPPEGFTRWTLDAFRVSIGKAPTNTGKVAMEALAENRTVKEDELLVADAEDHLEAATEDASSVTDWRASKKIHKAAGKAREDIEEIYEEKVHEAIQIVPPDDLDEARIELLNAMDEAFHGLHLSQAGSTLVYALDKTAKWIETWGHFVRHEGNPTEGELMLTRLNSMRAEVNAAFDRAEGKDSIEEGFEKLLSES